MKLKDLRKKTIGELESELKDKVKSLNEFKLGISKNSVKNTRNGRNLRKEIARILTLLREGEKA